VEDKRLELENQEMVFRNFVSTAVEDLENIMNEED
jgi:hypothetical protein